MADATPPPDRKRPDSDEIVLTDRDLVSRYIFYSENLSDISCSPGKACQEPLFSSPASNTSNREGDTSHISAVSNSTTQTTPLRNDLLALTRQRLSSTPLEEFEVVLLGAELPANMKDEYRERCRSIIQLSSHLFPRNRQTPRMKDRQDATALAVATGDWFVTAIHEAEIQTQNIDYIQTLGPFTASPRPDKMWANYKQMVELVLEHTRPPSRDLVRVIDALASVFDAYIYQPALEDVSLTNSDIELQLHGLYDAVMSLLLKHQHWCRSAKALINNCLRPTLETIVSTPAAMQSLYDHEAMRKVADEVLEDSANPGYLPVSVEALKVLREKRSTQLLQIRAKSKFARVHTV